MIHIQPPFLRPEISRQKPEKVRDNGIHGSPALQSKVRKTQSSAFQSRVLGCRQGLIPHVSVGLFILSPPPLAS